jgi:hypothetical protein
MKALMTVVGCLQSNIAMLGSRHSSACLGIPNSPWQTMGFYESSMGVWEYLIMVLFNVEQISITLCKVRIVVNYSVLQPERIKGLLSTSHSLTSHPITSTFFKLAPCKTWITLPSPKSSSYQSQSLPAISPRGRLYVVGDLRAAPSPAYVQPCLTHSLKLVRRREIISKSTH